MSSKLPNRRYGQRGFTLTEMLIAIVVVLFGLVAVAQLVPTSVMLNSNNRNDGTALVFAQRQMEAMREQPLSATTFTDPQGVTCPPSSTCNLGGPTAPGTLVGCSVVPNSFGAPIIDFSAPAASVCPPNYFFSYPDPNDPLSASYDVRWAVATITKGSLVTGKRIVVGVFRPGMETPTLPITLDTMVEK
jgi:prepilin-type N-terminal cleavage/methylation domain-containing protein